MLNDLKRRSMAGSARFKPSALLAASIALVTLAGCNGDNKLAEENSQLKGKVDALQSENQQLQSKLVAALAENNQLKAQPSSQTTNQNNKTDASNGAANNAAQTAGFSDITGIDGEQDIKNLAAIGALDTKNGAFDPTKPISRAQYVSWLVATNNIYFADQPTNKIRMAAASDTPTFVDVPPSNPAFRMIQGLANSGYVVGVDATHFAPDKPLTREQMIGIKAQVDSHGPTKGDEGTRQFVHFGDNGQIDVAYLGAMWTDHSAVGTDNIGRIWGNINVFHPKKAVTRAEAAVSLSKITHDGIAADIVKKKNG
jgi:hypothetical protein